MDCPCWWCSRERGEHKPTAEFVAKQRTKPRGKVWKNEGEIEEKRRKKLAAQS